jgi:hypothetical protein
VDRIEIAQALLTATGGGNYLEIGVSTGSSFIPLRAARKWGVDPGYHISWKRIAKYRLFSLLNIKQEKIFKETSDEFFEKHGQMLRSWGIDVGFVDGLHTYGQALRDVLNCLEYLNPQGIILMHDCNPKDEITALPAVSIDSVAARNVPGWTGEWSGDVWKAVVHLRSFREDLEVFVLDCDTGIGVVTRGPPMQKLSFSRNDIEKMDYRVLEKNRQHLLGLRPANYIYEFLQGRYR